MNASDEASVDRDAIKAHFIAERGYWRPWTEALLRDNPRFLQRYATYAGHPARFGPLSEKMVELIYVALDASSTHLFAGGLRTHLSRAIEIGVRPAEIHDVLHLVAAQGLDAVWSSLQVLADAIDARGRREPGSDVPASSVPPTSADTTDATDTTDAARRARRLAVGAPTAALALLERLDPGYLPVLLDFLEHGRPDDGLAPGDRALIEVALRACFTGHDAPALRARIDRALEFGRTPAEVMQAIQLGAHLAVHGTALGAATLADLRDPSGA